MKFVIDSDEVNFETILDFVFKRRSFKQITLSAKTAEKVQQSHKKLLQVLERNVPLYGVTTGFGDSCHRSLGREQSAALQNNLISYLLCGTGASLPRSASRAIFLLRLNSISRGYSGVSSELIEHMASLLSQDILPVIPCEGSLGASGDLIPLAYLGALIQGRGQASTSEGAEPTSQIFAKTGLKPYELKAKEGLALVNGTSAMAGLALVNYNDVAFLSDLTTLATSWLCLALKGKTEAFSELVNEKGKHHSGQAKVAKQIRALLAGEQYTATAALNVPIKGRQTEGYVQDRYSLRCVPQILGPVEDTLALVKGWLEEEIAGTSDNPLVDFETGEIALGGNFYGGYLAHGMDYLKISLANVADLIDRQLMTVIDDKSNRGLPPNLADWRGLSEDERHLHHGLKGLHQSVGAITSEVMAMSMPNSVFSRSSELHNQDKVSLGMSAAVSCQQMIEKLYSIQALYLVCLTQALDLRGIKLKGRSSKALYEMVRECVPFVDRDQPLDGGVNLLRAKLRKTAERIGRIIDESEKA